jgi:hypothetical protein
VKEFMTKFNIGKTQVYAILKAKSEICSNGSVKQTLRKSGGGGGSGSSI